MNHEEMTPKKNIIRKRKCLSYDRSTRRDLYQHSYLSVTGTTLIQQKYFASQHQALKENKLLNYSTTRQGLLLFPPWYMCSRHVTIMENWGRRGLVG